ncbi:MAG: hypothetical protein AAF366_22040, partial [Pseudomonadota bacterium]
QVPQLDQGDYSDGVYMPLGFGTPFTQSYAELTQQPPAQSPLGRGQRDLDLVEHLLGGDGVERIVGEFLVHWMTFPGSAHLKRKAEAFPKSV